VIRRVPEEIAQLFQKAIIEIDGGSTESIDTLIDEKLQGNYFR